MAWPVDRLQTFVALDMITSAFLNSFQDKARELEIAFDQAQSGEHYLTGGDLGKHKAVRALALYLRKAVGDPAAWSAIPTAVAGDLVLTGPAGQKLVLSDGVDAWFYANKASFQNAGEYKYLAAKAFKRAALTVSGDCSQNGASQFGWRYVTNSMRWQGFTKNGTALATPLGFPIRVPPGCTLSAVRAAVHLQTTGDGKLQARFALYRKDGSSVAQVACTQTTDPAPAGHPWTISPPDLIVFGNTAPGGLASENLTVIVTPDAATTGDDDSEFLLSVYVDEFAADPNVYTAEDQQVFAVQEVLSTVYAQPQSVAV